MADNEQVKSRKEAQLERLRKKYPDKKFEDDEEIYGQILDDYDQYDQELEGYKGREKQLSDMFASDPRSAVFLDSWRKGGDPAVELVRNYGMEIKDVIDDPEMQDKIAEANKEYCKKVAESKALDKEYEQNLDNTIEMLKGYQEERGLSDEQVDKIFEQALQYVRDGIMGKFSADFLDMINKGNNYDADVANANEEGVIAGRNSKITEQLRQSKRGDGTQPLGGRNSSPNQKRQRNMFDLANEAM